MKSPVAWNGICFVHVRSDDIYDYYQLDQAIPGLVEGRLSHDRSLGTWLACLNGSTAVREHTAPAPFQADTSVARLALDAAADALVSRMNRDRDFLVWLKSEGVPLADKLRPLAKTRGKKST